MPARTAASPGDGRMDRDRESRIDAVIAPAFPSNTARGGVLYPIVYSLARGGGSRVKFKGQWSRRRLAGSVVSGTRTGRPWERQISGRSA